MNKDDLGTAILMAIPVLAIIILATAAMLMNHSIVTTCIEEGNQYIKGDCIKP